MSTYRNEEASKLRVLVTGANGLLGRNLCIELYRQGIYTSATGRRSEKLSSNIFCEPCELTQLEKVDSLLKDFPCDAVVHCAGQKKGEDGISHFQNNLLSTINIAQASRNNGVKKLIYTSTISVYRGDGPFDESTSPQTDTAYATSKRAAEHALQLLSTLDFQVVILRLAGVHGSVRKTGVINSMIHNAILDQPLSVHEPGSTFSFTFLEDFVEAATSLLGSAWPTSYEIYNFASPGAINLSQLARFITAKTGSVSTLDNGNGLSRNRTVSVTRLSNDFGISAHSIESRIEEIIKSLSLK